MNVLHDRLAAMALEVQDINSKITNVTFVMLQHQNMATPTLTTLGHMKTIALSPEHLKDLGDTRAFHHKTC